MLIISNLSQLKLVKLPSPHFFSCLSKWEEKDQRTNHERFITGQSVVFH